MSCHEVALIGAGRIGAIHARNVVAHPGLNLKYISDVNMEYAAKLAAECGSSVVSVEQLLEDETVKGVIIASSTDTHADYIEMAARAGKSIFCEKPVDLSLERIDACMKTVEETGGSLLIGFNRRYDPHFSAVRAAMDEGQVGDLEMVVITSRDPSPPPAEYISVSGGIFRDMTIHDFDMARWLLGEEPVSIQATGSCLVDPAIGEQGDMDTVAVTMKTASGKICIINNSRRAAYGYDQRIEVFGSEGMVQANNIYENAICSANKDGFQSSRVEAFFLERYADAYRREMSHFAEVMDGTAKPYTDGHDGRQAMYLAEGALMAIKNGATVKL